MTVCGIETAAQAQMYLLTYLLLTYLLACFLHVLLTVCLHARAVEMGFKNLGFRVFL